MKNTNPNEALVKFAVEARKLGFTYGQLQQYETICKLKETELRKQRTKDKKKQDK